MSEASKDPAAVALGKKRAASFTSESQAAAARALAAGMTAKQRQDRARKAAETRHARKSGGK